MHILSKMLQTFNTNPIKIPISSKGVAQVLQHLHSKGKAMSLNLSDNFLRNWKNGRTLVHKMQGSEFIP